MNIIPIDKELLSFKNHLLINERTMFSAKYGDGKTYFLNEFKKKNAFYSGVEVPFEVKCFQKFGQKIIRLVVAERG